MRNLSISIALIITITYLIPLVCQAQEGFTENNHIAITATDYAFEAPDAISSGWSKIQFRNEGQDTHLLLFSKLPEGKSIDDYLTEAGNPYNEVWYQLRDRKITPKEAGKLISEQVPKWFWDVQFVGGAGLVTPGGVTEITVKLSPGNYVIECYAKTKDGEIHFMEGMARPLLVTDKTSDVSPPTEDIQLTISNYDMSVEGNISPGKRTVKVDVTEMPEQGIGHNVHVVRLEPEADKQKLVEWMNWFSPEGLRTPTPDHVSFIGGMHVLPVDNMGYFTVDLQPGRYLFVSGLTAHLGVMKEVTINQQ